MAALLFSNRDGKTLYQYRSAASRSRTHSLRGSGFAIKGGTAINLFLRDMPRFSVDLLRGFRARAKGEFVIESATAPQLGSSYSHYRAMFVFQRLTAWLRENGLDDQRPMHALRKEAGSIVCQNSGLFAASRFLRHADIHITAQHFVDKKERVTVGLGSLLAKKTFRSKPEFMTRDQLERADLAKPNGETSKTLTSIKVWGRCCWSFVRTASIARNRAR